MSCAAGGSVTELIRASGPDRYFGGTIETFALPMGAFIVISLILFYIYRRPHSVPRLRYLQPAHQTSFGTREPGTAGLVEVLPAPAAPAAPAAAPAAAEAPEAAAEAPEAAAEAPEAAESPAPAETDASSAGSDAPSAEGETF
jgi:pyruvate/2-oxoglutarate dehydrogenase complex dihydrolipoamide acyltransferase (E2) component